MPINIDTIYENSENNKEFILQQALISESDLRTKMHIDKCIFMEHTYPMYDSIKL